MDQNFAFREREFFPNLRVAIPSCRLNDSRSDVLGADIALSKVLFVENILQGFSTVPITLNQMSPAWCFKMTETSYKWHVGAAPKPGRHRLRVSILPKTFEFSKWEIAQVSKKLEKFPGLISVENGQVLCVCETAALSCARARVLLS